MALIVCPECGKEVSDTCEKCIHCGYSLQTPQHSKRKFDLKAFISKHKIRIFAIAVLAVLVVSISSVIPKIKQQDPFEAVYGRQSVSAVHKQHGTPDRSEWFEYNGNGCTCDIYYDTAFLKGSGTLRVAYYFDDVAWSDFTYMYSSDTPTSKERDEAQEYIQAIIDYYTEKFGSPSDGYNGYEWNLPEYETIYLYTAKLESGVAFRLCWVSKEIVYSEG